MNAVQVGFLVCLILVLVAVAAFSGIVIWSATRNGRTPILGLLGRQADYEELGRAAFYAHRISGFAIFAFLCLHILDVGLYSVSHRLYDEVQRLYGSAPLRLFESGLLFAVLFHTGNGLRLVIADLHAAPGRSRRLLRIVIATTVVAGAAGSAFILAPLIR